MTTENIVSLLARLSFHVTMALTSLLEEMLATTHGTLTLTSTDAFCDP
jgi:hypothetical protein